MAKTPLTVTVITDTHYYSKKTGTKGKAYDAANAKSQKLLKYSEELLRAAFKQIKKINEPISFCFLAIPPTTVKLRSREFIEMLDLKRAENAFMFLRQPRLSG
ncbi:MAG: hypothetical protein ACLRPJ_03830 [Acutalibacteraceae bacterium]